MNVKKKLGFIGAGNMAEALARGLVENKVFKASELIASDVDAARRRKFKGALKIEVTTDNLKVLSSSRAVLFAVKPQTIDAVLTELARTAGGEGNGASRSGGLGAKLFVSIAAGVTLSRLEGALGGRARVIRVMPNAPAMVGQGIVRQSARRRCRGAGAAARARASDGAQDDSWRGGEHAPLADDGGRADSDRRVSRRHHRSRAQTIRRRRLF